MNTRFYNAKILTLDGNYEVVDGEVWVEGNRITQVGSPIGKNAPMWDREIDVGGNVLMPGFKNAHTHSAMTLLRSYADDLPLYDWLYQQVFPIEAKLSGEDVYHLSKLAILEYLTSGITSNLDMYDFPEQVAQASVDCGFRTVISGGLSDFGQKLADIEHWYHYFNDYHELIGYRMGFHAEYTNSKEHLMQLSALAHQHQAPVYTHNSETEREVRECIGRYGITPTRLFDQLGLFDFGGGAYHCVHMTDEDLDILASRDVSVVTNPASNLKLASGIAPITAMIRRGISIGIGTDGPASNNCLDMFREMFLVTGLAKIKENDASAVDAYKVLSMAVSGGAKAMGLSYCDAISAGNLADLIILDLRQPNMQPLNNIAKNIVYSGSKQNVILTMVNGKILYENGEFLIGEDSARIYETANKIIRRLADD